MALRWKILGLVACVTIGLVWALTPSGERERRAAERFYEDRTRGDRRDDLQLTNGGEQELVQQQLDVIQRELARLGDHPWAGLYRSDEGPQSAQIALAPDAGAVFLRSGTRQLLATARGSASERADGRIEVLWNHGLERAGLIVDIGRQIPWLSNDLVPVRWGERRYLLPATQMRRFLNAVNDGSALDRRDFPEREPRSSASPAGAAPEVPSEFRAYLLDAPVQATLVELDLSHGLGERRVKGLFLPLSAWIDAGTDRGLKPGMVLWIQDRPGYAEGEVMEVEPGRARVVFLLDPGVTREPEALAPGWSVSTLRPSLH